MRKKLLKRKQKGFLWPPLLFIGALLLVGYLFGTTLNLKSTTDPNESFIINKTIDYSKKENVQLGTVDLIQNTPTPIPTITTDACNHDMSKKADPDKCFCDNAWLIKCEGGKCTEINYSKSGAGSGMTCDSVNSSSPNWCDLFGKEGDGWYCIGKPVIYLYPEKPTYIDVTVKTDGEIFVSDPRIEYYEGKKEGGWQNVFAHPDGTLIYKNKTYRELFYESLSQDIKRPEKGIVLTKKDLRKDLLSFITRLGLARIDEQKEFMDWWIPRLEKLPTDKIFVSLLEKDEKSRLDRVDISPKPDTFIEFIVYFAPISENETATPLVLPPAPQRKGFTAIEWGGVIGK